VSFGSRELQFINLYLQHVHPSYPTVPYRMLRDGINPVNLEMLGLPGAGDMPRLYASRAASWAAAAYGASFVDVSLAQEYMGAAVRHLRQCFEVPIEEIVTAYMMVGETCFQLGRPDLFYRYIEFAGEFFVCLFFVCFLGRERSRTSLCATFYFSPPVRRTGAFRADAMEETMPEMSRERQLVLAYIRMHALSVSNKTRFYPKAAILPPLEEIESMDLRLRAMFLSQLGAQKIEEVVFHPSVDKAEKVRVCREVINLMNPVLDQLENDPQYSNCILGRFGLYVQMCYFWAACGNRERALWYCDRFLEILETNLHFMALPEMAHLRLASTFLTKLGAYDLQHRLERLFTVGRRYVIWTPQRTTEVDLLLHIEALLEDLCEGCGYESPSQATVIDTSDTSTTQGSLQCVPLVEKLDNDDDDGTDLWELLDDIPVPL
jgi:hypothetical protein